MGKLQSLTGIWSDPSSIQGDGRVDRTPGGGKDSKTIKLSCSSFPSFTNEQEGYSKDTTPTLRFIHLLPHLFPVEFYSSRPQPKAWEAVENMSLPPLTNE